MHSQMLHGLFLEQAARTPSASAVIAVDGTLSYSELAGRASAVAQVLRAQRFGAEALIGVRMAHSLELPICLLGILQAGYAFLPLDPRQPEDRVARIVEEAQPRQILTGIGNDTSVAAQTIAPAFEMADSLAYVIYTSGSTGRPKGVEIAHRAAVNTLLDINRLCEVSGGDRVLNVSSIGFDLSIYDLFGAWAAGAAVVLARDTQYPEPAEWAEQMQTSQVTVWDSAPALLEMLLDFVERRPGNAACFERLRVAMLSGDRISPRLIQRLLRFAPRARVLAMGGATEASIW